VEAGSGGFACDCKICHGSLLCKLGYTLFGLTKLSPSKSQLFSIRHINIKCRKKFWVWQGVCVKNVGFAVEKALFLRDSLLKKRLL
jgi:hypothetical protein